MNTARNIIVGLTATRNSGKDTLFECFHELNPAFRHRAFANALKRDVAGIVRDHMGFDPDNLTPEQKEIVRPLWIGYGMAQRARDPLHWVKVVARDIEMDRGSDSGTPRIETVVDCRFENEVNYFRERFGSSFYLINITRAGAPPPTEEEEKHCHKVAAMADYHLNWGKDTKEERLNHARRILKWLDIK
jgi:hypothetical protein